MRVVSGVLACALQPGDRIVSLQGHDRPYTLETAYAGRASPMGVPVSITLIMLPGPNPGLHPLLEFHLEWVVSISLQVADPLPMNRAHDATAT
jgi:hypothetical protein